MLYSYMMKTNLKINYKHYKVNNIQIKNIDLMSQIIFC